MSGYFNVFLTTRIFGSVEIVSFVAVPFESVVFVAVSFISIAGVDAASVAVTLVSVEFSSDEFEDTFAFGVTIGTTGSGTSVSMS